MNSRPRNATAWALGLVALVAIALGVSLVIWGGQTAGNGAPGILIRVGAVIGGLALVLPAVRRPKPGTMMVAAAGVLLVLARPSLVWAALLGWLVWITLGRQRRMERSDR